MGAALPVTFVRRRGLNRRHLAMWRGAAETAGLTIRAEQTSFLEGSTLHCRTGDLDVVIDSFPARGSPSALIRVKPLDATAGLSLRVEAQGPAFLKDRGTPEVEIGDAAFDRRFLIEGPAARAFAVLDVETRRLVGAAMSGGAGTTAGSAPSSALLGAATLESGELGVNLKERARSEDELTAALRTVLRAAASLATPRDIPECLAANAVRDPLPEVRLGNLKALVREFPRRAAVRPVLRRCCDDSDDEIRLYAATALREEGGATLLSLAFGAPWPQLPAAAESVAARAVDALGTALPADRALRELGEMLERRRLQTACACIDSLALDGRGASVAGCEDALIRALAHDEGGVRASAARALGRVGSATAVLPLREAAERFAGDTRSTARQAVAQIQSRLHGASPGQVSITASSAGEVSLAETGGEVSLSRPD
jgi:hypothetical protein